mgnify:CR=1 FL=1
MLRITAAVIPLDPEDALAEAGLGIGRRHLHEDLPTLLIGRGGGYFKPGRRVIFRKETPMTNFHLTLMDRMGVPTEQFGDATGPLDPAEFA